MKHIDQSFKLLSIVWGDTEGYVMLPQKSGTSWKEKAFKWPQEQDKIKEWLIKGDNTPNCNQYWCPNVFKSTERHNDNVKVAKVLYADLDEIDPQTIPAELRPSVAWESSPQRYQALWFLDKTTDAKNMEIVNQKLTYHLDADKSGWDLSQVLRVPNMKNFKYEGAPRGKLLWYEKSKYNLATVDKQLGDVNIYTASKDIQYVLDDDKITLTELMFKYDNIIPQKVRKELMTPGHKIEGDRSSKLWEIEVQLAESGVPRDDIYRIVKRTAWNKYTNRRDEQERLLIEIDKVLSYVGTKPIITTSVGRQRKMLAYKEMMGNVHKPPSWLVEGFWTVGGHGMIAGEPKTYKSTIVSEIAFSIASGKKLFDTYEVHNTGPVLIIQEENSPGLMQDRFRKLAVSRGVAGEAFFTYPNKVEIEPPQELPIYYINNEGISLSNGDDRKYIENCINEIIKETNEALKMLVLDPLYLMLGDVDENSSKELRDILNWLLYIRYKYGTAILIVHHWNKSGTSKRGGQRMLGSVTLHGWVSSAIYTRIEDDAEHIISIEREFREFEKPPNIQAKFSMGSIGDMYYSVEVSADNPKSSDAILALIQECPDGITERDLCAATEMGRTAIRARLESLESKGLIQKGKLGRSNVWIPTED